MPCEIKFLEVRDRGTFIPVMATRLSGDRLAARALLRRAGFSGEELDDPEHPDPYVILTKLVKVEAQYDPFAWEGPGARRTMTTAHRYVIERWGSLADGDVVDVEFIRNETPAPKVSEVQHL